eukprot:m.125677 g.125677  ORF g.125677 m.125677 type:complete len:349 (+) comp11174_c0_seq2:2168-3214(+)
MSPPGWPKHSASTRASSSSHSATLLVRERSGSSKGSKRRAAATATFNRRTFAKGSVSASAAFASVVTDATASSRRARAIAAVRSSCRPWLAARSARPSSHSLRSFSIIPSRILSSTSGMPVRGKSGSAKTGTSSSAPLLSSPPASVSMAGGGACSNAASHSHLAWSTVGATGVGSGRVSISAARRLSNTTGGGLNDGGGQSRAMVQADHGLGLAPNVAGSTLLSPPGPPLPWCTPASSGGVMVGCTPDAATARFCWTSDTRPRMSSSLAKSTDSVALAHVQISSSLSCVTPEERQRDSTSLCDIRPSSFLGSILQDVLTQRVKSMVSQKGETVQSLPPRAPRETTRAP